MSYLADLLNAREPQFSYFVAQSESRHNNPGFDLKLITHLRNSSAALMRDLKLDPKDTTGEELYQALNNRFKRDARAWLSDLQPIVPKLPSRINWSAVTHNLTNRHGVGINGSVSSAQTNLGKLIYDHDSLRFWQHHLLTGVMLNDQLVSANLFDVHYNVTHKLPFTKRQVNFFQTGLLDDLVGCYQNHKHDIMDKTGK